MIGARDIFFNPVAGKELRTRMRGWRAAVILFAYIAILGVIAIAFLWQQASPTSGQATPVWTGLFETLSAFQLLLILFVTPVTVAAAISGERQCQTWDLLRVSRLSSFSIVYGKLLAAISFNLLLLLASLPLFSLVFLFGGISPTDVIHVYIVFIATILLLSSAGLLVSALTERVQTSMITAASISFLISAGIALFAFYIQNVGVGKALTSGTISGPSLTPAVEFDPVIALLSALPLAGGGEVLGNNLAMVHHAFGVGPTMPLWGVFAILAVVFTIGFALLAMISIRPPSRLWSVGR
ncbi:MAG: ABC transporter permease [Chloroflexota bacterium]